MNQHRHPRGFAVASDDAQSFIFLLPALTRTNLREQLLRSRRPKREKDLALNRRSYPRIYSQVVRWLNFRTCF